jgi:hypothetical protein
VTVRASAPGYDASKQRKVLRLKHAKAPNTPRPPA